MTEDEANKLTDRLEHLLASAHDAFLKGDVTGSLMLLAEAKKTAEKLPRKKDAGNDRRAG